MQEEKPSTSFTFAASVTAPDVKRVATVFRSRILGFLRFLLFQDETNNMHPLFAKADRPFSEVSRGTHSTVTGITRFTPAIQDANFRKLFFCAP